MRIKNTYRAVTTTRNKRAAIRVGWRILFDKRKAEETGDVEYGGDFPLRKIEQLAEKEQLAHSDSTLIELISRAERVRMEEAFVRMK